MPAYERTLETLYQAPLAEFIALRDRLAAEMRARGDRPSAGRLTARRRPTISAWVVNQLYWQKRADFDHMRATAERLRAGDLDAAPAYRQSLATLRRRAAEILTKAGHGAGEAVLARVTNTLAAVAAIGFEPDSPGTLATDRDPPGFDIGRLPSGRVAPPRAKNAARDAKGHSESTREHAAEAKQRRVTELAEKRRAVERARRERERERVARDLAGARAELEQREKALARLRRELGATEQAVADAHDRVRELDHALGALDEES